MAQVKAKSFWKHRLICTLVHCFFFFIFTTDFQFANKRDVQSDIGDAVFGGIHSIYLLPMSAARITFGVSSLLPLTLLFFVNIILLTYIDLYRKLNHEVSQDKYIEENKTIKGFRTVDGNYVPHSREYKSLETVDISYGERFIAINKKVVEFLLTANIKSYKIGM